MRDERKKAFIPHPSSFIFYPFSPPKLVLGLHSQPVVNYATLNWHVVHVNTAVLPAPTPHYPTQPSISL
jgi:hypothetical protein